ncbi:hypothetical protein B0H63DRAFT_466173 [Podospora didyma]|uniref:Uncharacterized protein n=1 Tax=Podospora didyma TaxID=330526 RepID=A0AAE0NZR8_9PEZI|nr:hypothetical protein B0H63DRAFT_466173 [Podospora didyma]
MPIKKVVKKGQAPPPSSKAPTGVYSDRLSRPEAYKPIQPIVTVTPIVSQDGIPVISTRELNYFFNLAVSLYDQAPIRQPEVPDAPPGYGADLLRNNNAIDASATLVMWLFRQTRTDILPVAETFHLGPADRQPLYSLTAQPSIRSATEFNELVIKRRDPINNGAWYGACTADIEPALDLVKPGRWTVAKLVLDSMPVWKKMVAGQVIAETVDSAKRSGNALSLSWGDRATLGCLGEAYGLWWDSGSEQGTAATFYVTEGWRGFGTQGVIRVKPAARNASGGYLDPRNSPFDLAAVYFFGDGKTPPRFVCANVEAQIRLDVIMAGLMTVMVVETRKRAVIKELGSLPAYDSNAHWQSRLVERGPDYNEAYMD